MKMNHRQTKPKREIPPLTLSGYVWIFTMIAFFGWCFEKLGRWYLYPTDVIRDRGFLTLPFCGIYGACVVVIGFLLGSPNDLSKFWKRAFRWAEGVPRPLRLIGRMLGYFVAVTLVATLIELAVGLPFELLGKPLWNYHDRWGNLWGVICPNYSILWGFLATILMSIVWKPLRILVGRIPKKALRIGAIVMVSVLLADFAFNVIYLAVTGSRFYFL